MGRVVCPFGGSVSIGLLLSSSVQVTTRPENHLTEMLRVKYAQNLDKSAFFINVTTVSPALGRVGHPKETFWDQRKHPSITRLYQKGQNGKTAA